MSKIKIMDSHLANMIAAGEVVERPSGIVKELVENSLDAKASDISIDITEGGMDSIIVIDNGEGMNAEDLEKAFKRHSTSKVYAPEDLMHIHSFGFRGEALPSIASVSTVHITTHNGEEGHRIVIDNSIQKELVRAARNKGTTVEVHSLFSRVPARLKYIKNPKYEASIIVDTVQKFAIAHPNISFKLTSDGKEVFRSIGNNSLNDVFYRVFGAEPATDAMYIINKDYDFEIEGIFAQPVHTRANRYSIWLYINNRMIRSPRIQKAIIDGYRRHIPSDRFPIAILKINVDPQLVDVNVHPSKWEIRLSKEAELIQLVLNSIEEKLAEKTQAPRIKIEKEVYEQTTMIEELLDQQTEQRKEKIKEEMPQNVLYQERIIVRENEQTNDNQEEIKETDSMVNEVMPGKDKKIEPLDVLAQMSGKYILAQGDTGLYIIDQHAAMERVRYEFYQNKLLNMKTPTQPLLFPLILEGRSVLVHRESEVKKAFEELQIEIEVFDQDAFVIRERPLWIPEEELKEFSEKTLDYIEEHKQVREEDFRNNALATLACHSSVRFNEYMSMDAMITLVEKLRSCAQPYHCPHGRPTFMIVDHKMLWKGFLR